MANPPTVLSRLPARCREAKQRPTYPTLLTVAVACIAVGWGSESAAQDDGAVGDSGAANVDSGDASDAALEADTGDAADDAQWTEAGCTCSPFRAGTRKGSSWVVGAAVVVMMGRRSRRRSQR